MKQVERRSAEQGRAGREIRRNRQFCRMGDWHWVSGVADTLLVLARSFFINEKGTEWKRGRSIEVPRRFARRPSTPI